MQPIRTRKNRHALFALLLLFGTSMPYCLADGRAKRAFVPDHIDHVDLETGKIVISDVPFRLTPDTRVISDQGTRLRPDALRPGMRVRIEVVPDSGPVWLLQKVEVKP